MNNWNLQFDKICIINNNEDLFKRLLHSGILLLDLKQKEIIFKNFSNYPNNPLKALYIDNKE